ncbi:DUF1289 domain-containing protein [Marinomonas agarivorans]|nr:DUF1289 domain-containing protein [Marinomonas agarivorans]
MEQIELFSIDSPCRNKCKSSKTGFCTGCLRSREERFQWFQMSDVEKRKTIQRCKTRWQKVIKAREDKLTTQHHLPYGMTDDDVQLLLIANDEH